MTTETPEDFLPIDRTFDATITSTGGPLEAVAAPIAAFLWLAFMAALVCAPVVVIAAWRWAL